MAQPQRRLGEGNPVFDNLDEIPLQLTEDQIEEKRREWGGAWIQQSDTPEGNTYTKTDKEVRAKAWGGTKTKAWETPNPPPTPPTQSIARGGGFIPVHSYYESEVLNSSLDNYSYGTFYESDLSRGIIESFTYMTGPSWHEDPIELKNYTNTVTEVLNLKQQSDSGKAAASAKAQNEVDMDTVISITDWDAAVASYISGDYTHVTAYMENLWGDEEWDAFLKEQQPMEEEGEGSVIGFARNDINVLQNAIGRYLRTHDLPEPSFLLNEEELTDNAKVLLEDERKSSSSSTDPLDIRGGSQIAFLRQLLDLDITQENIDELFASGPDGDFYMLKDQFSKEAIDNLRSGLDLIESLDVERQALQEDLPYLNREIPLSEHRSRAILRVYNKVENIDGALDENDFTINEVEMNRSIDSIVSRAMQGEWDHDTNMRIIDTYTMSFKNFKETSQNNSTKDAIRKGIHQSAVSKNTAVSANSTLRHGFFTGQGQWADVQFAISDRGFSALDEETQRMIIGEVDRINQEANDTLVAVTGVEIPGGVALLDINKIIAGEWGLDFKEMSPMHLWLTGTYLMSDQANNNYLQTPETVAMFGKTLLDVIQSIEQEYGEGSLISSEQLREDPEAIRDFMVTIGLLGDLNRMSVEMGGEGKQFLNKLWQSVATDPTTQRFMRSVSLAFSENLKGEMLFGMKLPEFLHMLYDGTESFETPVLDEEGKPTFDDEGNPITKMIDMDNAFTLLVNTMDGVSRSLVDTLLFLVDPKNLGEATRTGNRLSHPLSRVTGLEGGMNRVGALSKGQYILSKENIEDLQKLGILYPERTDTDSWDKMLAGLQESNVADILSNSLTNGGDLSLASSHDQVVALFNIYLNNPDIRSTIEGLIISNTMRGRTVSMASMISETNMILERMNVTAVPNGVDGDGGLASIGFLPGTPLDLSEVPMVEGSGTAATKANTILSNNYFIKYMPPRQRTTGNFATFTGDTVQGFAVPQEVIDGIDSTTFDNMTASLGEAVMLGLGFDPNTEEGKKKFIKDIMFTLWEQEAKSWGGKENDWRPRTPLDFSSGALQMLMENYLNMKTIPDWLKKIGATWSNVKADPYGRFRPRLRAEFVIEDRVDKPLGGSLKSKSDAPRIQLYANDANRVERLVGGFNWRLDQTELDLYNNATDDIEAIDAKDPYTNTLGALSIELNAVAINLVGKALEKIEALVPEGSAESTRVRDIIAIPDDIYFGIAESINQYKFYHGEYPTWWRDRAGLTIVPDDIEESVRENVGSSVFLKMTESEKAAVRRALEERKASFPTGPKF